MAGEAVTVRTSGVVIGRFQVPELHDGHRWIIETVQAKHPHAPVVIGIGVSPWSTTARNPLNYALRAQMITELYPNAVTFPVIDHPTDGEWSRALDHTLHGLCPFGAKLYGSRDSFIPHYSGRYPTEELTPAHELSGSTERERAGDGVRYNTDFRTGIIYATQQQYPPVLPTIDVAPVRRMLGDAGRFHVALCRKPWDTKLSFVGGFIDPNDTSVEHTVRRELLEETELSTEDTPRYMGSARIDDWRLRGERSSIMTSFWLVAEPLGSLTARDDIAHAEWVPITANLVDMIVPRHQPLVGLLHSFAAREFSSIWS